MKWLSVPLSTVVRNVIMNHFQALALHKTKHHTAFLHTYVDRKFVHWSHTESNKLRNTGYAVYQDTQTSYLDFLITWKTFTLSIKVHRNPATYSSNHLPHVKAGDIQSLRNRATIICQGNQDLTYEMDQPIYYLPLSRGLSGYWARRRVVDSRGPVLVGGLSVNK
jgi:hypothetical protein